VIKARRPGDPEQPNAQASGLAEIAGPGKRFEKRVLTQVLGIGDVPGKAQANTENILLENYEFPETPIVRCGHIHGSVMSYRRRSGGKNIPFFARRQPKKALIFGLIRIKMKTRKSALGVASWRKKENHTPSRRGTRKSSAAG
jgi:hypothetical protein